MGSLVCRVEINKTKGLVLTVENEDGKITQTAVMDGKSITLTVKGNEETSTIVQKPESIAIKCKTFTLDAETITCNSEKDTAFTSKAKYKIKSTDDLSIETDANASLKAAKEVDVKASKDLSASGSNVSLSADSKGEFTGSEITIKAKTGAATVNGMDLKLAATKNATMEGKLGVKISSTAKLELESTGTAALKGTAKLDLESTGMATLKGTMVDVKGDAIASIGGSALTKVG